MTIFGKRIFTTRKDRELDEAGMTTLGSTMYFIEYAKQQKQLLRNLGYSDEEIAKRWHL